MKAPSWEAGPRDDAPDPHPLAEAVLAILEDAGVETATCDAVCKVIEQYFQSLEKPEPEYDLSDGDAEEIELEIVTEAQWELIRQKCDLDKERDA